MLRGIFSMIISVPKEIKNNENRVAMTPAGVDNLVNAGHTVLVEANAGAGSSFTDDEYKEAGAEILKKRFRCMGKGEHGHES